MQISFCYQDTDKRIHLTAKSKKLIHTIISVEKKKLGEITVIFTSNQSILNINKSYLKHNYFTDVITFDSSVKQVISGDIFISIDQVASNAKKYGVKVSIELARVLIHGVLHLIGYLDKSDKEREIMRSREDFYLVKGEKLDLLSGDEFTL